MKSIYESLDQTNLITDHTMVAWTVACRPICPNIETPMAKIPPSGQNGDFGIWKRVIQNATLITSVNIRIKVEQALQVILLLLLHTKDPLPPLHQSQYSLRRQDVVGRIVPRTEKFKSSFFSNCIFEWNKLDPEF